MLIPKVLVLLSAYNGKENIKRQIDSIMQQELVDVSLIVRDDGSKDSTVSVLRDLEKEYPNKITIYTGSNIGWRRSFFELIKIASLYYDYYAFSDQDDYWFKDKLLESINPMQSDDYDGCKFSQCLSMCVDESFNPVSGDTIKPIIPKSRMSSMTTEFSQGCGMVWNKQAMELLKRHIPADEFIPHDVWVGTVCFLSGKMYYINKKLFYYIRYKNSASTLESLQASRLKRVKTFFKNEKTYINLFPDLLTGYQDKLTDREVLMCKRVIHYKKSLFNKMYLLFSPNLVRNHLSSTLLFKLSILLNKF